MPEWEPSSTKTTSICTVPSPCCSLPNEDLLASNGDAVNPDPNQINEIVEFTATGHFVAEVPVDTFTTSGGAFGIALAKFGNKVRLAAVDDNLNAVEVWEAR